MLSDPEFENLMADPTKKIAHNIHWMPSESHDDAQEFVVAVQSEASWPLRITGQWNPESQKLSLALIHTGAGRIVGLDFNPTSPHHNPDCRRTRSTKRRCDCPRGTHLQRWSEEEQMSWAYAAPEITATWDDPVAAWRQFCALINVAHRGILSQPER